MLGGSMGSLANDHLFWPIPSKKNMGKILVGGFNPSGKHARQIWSFPQVWVKSKKKNETTTQSQLRIVKFLRRPMQLNFVVTTQLWTQWFFRWIQEAYPKMSANLGFENHHLPMPDFWWLISSWLLIYPVFAIFTLHKTNIAPKNWWLGDDQFLLGCGLFSGAFTVSFRVDITSELVQDWSALSQPVCLE